MTPCAVPATPAAQPYGYRPTKDDETLADVVERYRVTITVAAISPLAAFMLPKELPRVH